MAAIKKEKLKIKKDGFSVLAIIRLRAGF